MNPTVGGATVVDADVLLADSLLATTVTFNGSWTPSTNLTDAPSDTLVVDDSQLAHESRRIR